MARLNPNSTETGDIILVLGSDKDTPLIRLAQDLARLPSILKKVTSRSRYSHVMLVVSPGVVVHADGKAVRMELLTDAIGTESFVAERIRAVRPNNPPLSDIEQVQVAFEACRFLKQKYSLIYSRNSSVVGRALRDQRGITQPFCSELVATAYQAIGRPVCERPPDQTLPVDLEQYCIPPGWRDVTAELETDEMPESIRSLLPPIKVGNITKSFEEWWADSEKHLREAGAIVVKRSDLDYKHAVQMVEACVDLAMVKSLSLTVAKKLALDPESLFRIAGNMVEADLRALPEFYRQIRKGLTPEEPSIASRLKKLYPAQSEESSPLEILPSFRQLAEFELQGESLSFSARALRLGAALSIIAVAFEVPIKGLESVSVSLKNEAFSYLHLVEPITEEEKSELLESVNRFSVAGATDTEQLREMCARVVGLHRVLSILRPGLEEKLQQAFEFLKKQGTQVG